MALHSNTFVHGNCTIFYYHLELTDVKLEQPIREDVIGPTNSEMKSSYSHNSMVTFSQHSNLLDVDCLAGSWPAC